MSLNLKVIDCRDRTHWTWALTDGEATLASHEVAIDPDDGRYLRLASLGLWSTDEAFARVEGDDPRTLQSWVSEHLLGPIGPALCQKVGDDGLEVLLELPAVAAHIAELPLEIATVEGVALFERGIIVVNALEEDAGPVEDRPARDSLRILVVLGLPDTASPENSREEASAFREVCERAALERSASIDLRVLQYGATRDTLRALLDEAPGWDWVHFSLRGGADTLMLEAPSASMDRIPLTLIGQFLERYVARPQLVTFNAEWSSPSRSGPARADVTSSQLVPTALAMARGLGCAVVPVRGRLDHKLTRLFYRTFVESVLESQAPLGIAMSAARQALSQAGAGGLKAGGAFAMCGRRAALVKLPMPWKVPSKEEAYDPRAKLPPSPPRFVGRLGTMMRATLALSDGSASRAVLFYGTVGAGKTTCARELVRRHEPSRFESYVWFDASTRVDPGTALVHFLFELESSLQVLGHPLTSIVDDDDAFLSRGIERLRALMVRRSVLIVLDELEAVLSDSRVWATPKWDAVMKTLVAHDGPSRLVMTSRYLPGPLEQCASVRLEPIHVLPRDEAMLWAEQLPLPGTTTVLEAPNEAATASGSSGMRALYEILEATQGHALLLDALEQMLSCGEEVDQARARVSQALNGGNPEHGRRLAVYLEKGMTDFGGAEFASGVARWVHTELERLTPAARLLLGLACSIERQDRTLATLTEVFDGLLEAGAGAGGELSAQKEAPALNASLERLSAAGLVRLAPGSGGPGLEGASATDTSGTVSVDAAGANPPQSQHLELHPFIAASVRQRTEETAVEIATRMLADRWRRETSGGVANSGPARVRLMAEAVLRGTPYWIRETGGVETIAAVRQVLKGEPTTAVIALVTAVLRGLEGENRSAEAGPGRQHLLAEALLSMQRADAAEAMLLEAIAESEAAGDVARAADAAGVLIELLMQAGRNDEALSYINKRASWRRDLEDGSSEGLRDQTRKLRILADQGEYDQVLGAAAQLVGRMDGDKTTSGSMTEQREDVLRTARSAALNSGQWRAALEMSKQLRLALERRHASDVELARAELDDYWPILKLAFDGYDEARAMLQGCRNVFEQAEDARELGRVYAAQADLEDAADHAAAASWLAQTALRYAYQAGDPEACALIHANLAGYLERRGAPAAQALSHRLASALLAYQIESKLLEPVCLDLASSQLSDNCPSFEKIVDVVEKVKGARFCALFDNLPARADTGEATMKAVWSQMIEHRMKREALAHKRQKLIGSLPSPVRAAFDQEGEAFTRALESGLSQLAEEDAERVVEQLVEAGIIRPDKATSISETLRTLDPLLRGIAEVALGNQEQQSRIVVDISRLRQKGWKIGPAVQRIWKGERDLGTLTEDLDANSRGLIEAVLALVEREEAREG